MISLRRGFGATNTSYNSQILAAIPQYCPSCPPSLVLSLVNQESGGNQYKPDGTPLVGAAGDTGLFQLIPSTAASLGVDATTPAGNIQGGLTLLQQNYTRYGDWTQTLEAYNQGPTSLANQLAAGVTPTSAGYASSILAAAGVPDSTSPSYDPATDSSVSGSLLPSFDLSTLTDLPDATGLSWTTLGIIGAGIFAFILFLKR